LLSKILALCVLPPGGLFFGLLLGVVFMRKLWGKALIGLCLVLLYTLSTEPIRDILMHPLEFQYPIVQTQDLADEGMALVLLGGGVYEQAPEYGGQDSLHTSALLRTFYASKLAKETKLDVYATGGKPLQKEQKDAEGTVMKRVLVAWGLSPEHVFAENLANNTWENATRIRDILQKKGIHTVVLVTSAWHMPRSVACFRAQGLNVIPAPTDYLTKMTAYDARSFIPQAAVFEDSVRALHEYLGLLFYRVRYGVAW